MPAAVEKIRKALHREHPGMAKSRTYAIAVNAFKKKHGLRGHTTEGEMMRTANEKTAQDRPGFSGGPYAAGPGGTCVCTSCGHSEKHTAGESCRSKKCPECGASMARKGFEKVSAFEEGFYDELEKISQEPYMPFATRHPALAVAVPWGTLQAKGQIAAHGQKALEKSPWSVRHPLLHPFLSSLGGGAGGALAGAGIASALGRDPTSGALIGGQLGGLGGGIGSRIYGGMKGKKRIQELSR